MEMPLDMASLLFETEQGAFSINMRQQNQSHIVEMITESTKFEMTMRSQGNIYQLVMSCGANVWFMWSFMLMWSINIIHKIQFHSNVT